MIRCCPHLAGVTMQHASVKSRVHQFSQLIMGVAIFDQDSVL